MADQVTRDEAYDRIDRILRNNLDDADYATFSGYLEQVYQGDPPQWAVCPVVPGASCASRIECAGGCVRHSNAGMREASPSLTDGEIDRLQEQCDCFGCDSCDIRIHEFARAVEAHTRGVQGTSQPKENGNG